MEKMENEKKEKLNGNETKTTGIIPEIVIYIILTFSIPFLSFLFHGFDRVSIYFNLIFLIIFFLISFFINNKRKNEKFYATVLLFIIYVVYLMFTYWTEINRYGTSFEAFLSSLRNNDFNLGYLALIGAVFVGALTSHIKDKITTVKK